MAKQKLNKCGTAKEIGQVHTYLEHRGYINFGCGNLLIKIINTYNITKCLNSR